MTVCPIAIVAGCRKCPAFAVCPLKTLLGDQASTRADADAAPPETAKRRPAQSKSRKAGG